MQTPADILSKDGSLSELIEDYAVRDQQIEMAEAIADALHNKESLVCEAGTGTGKTFAYLIPTLQSGMKTIISTGTKHLQDQLFQRDLKIIQQAVGIPVNVALLKGRGNYLCLEHLRIAEQDNRMLDKASLAQLRDVKEWSQQTNSGDLAELTNLPENAAVRTYITSTTDNCLGQNCDFYNNCFVFRARRQAIEADVTIVNHHLLLADMALREQGYGELLPVADVVIFDEAHQLPDLVSQFFSVSLTSHQYFDLLRDCKAAYFDEAADLPKFLELLDTMETAIRQLRLAFGRDGKRIAWHQIKDDETVKAALSVLMERSHDVHHVLDGFANRGKKLDACFKRLSNMMNLLDSFMEPDRTGAILWLEIRGQGFLLHQTPLDIAQAFQERMSEYECQCIYTSATLTVNNSFDHFSHRLGINETKEKIWSSPFDFMKQALLYLPTEMPDPRDEGYTERVVEAAIPVLNLTRGRAFFLFTSHRALKLAAESIASKIDYPIFVQGQAPRTELLDSFRRTKHAVLLGTQSFWEGVDVKGQALSCVIIDKLPFAAPDDPVLQARMKRLEEEGGKPFMEHQLPEAVIVLKQGVGRLIRDSRDYGVLMICDPRLTTKSYGKLFLKSLPQMNRTNSLVEVKTFFDQFEENQEKVKF